MKFFFIITFSLSLLWAAKSKNAFEVSYPRDNTFCNYKGKRVQFLIRGESKYTESREKGYGEFIFYKIDEMSPKLMPLNDFRSDTFKLFPGQSKICSKSLGITINTNTFAVLFLKENKPFKDKLVIQLFDITSMTPKDFIETTYSVDKVRELTNGFSFRAFKDNHKLDAGKINIQGTEYIYHEKDFSQWVTYQNNKFEIDGKLSFENFPWKEYFKNIEDFYSTTGWIAEEKKFNNEIIFFAVNHKLKKGCLLVIQHKEKLTGSEAWRCQDL
jgi:hypothetical protein